MTANLNSDPRYVQPLPLAAKGDDPVGGTICINSGDDNHHYNVNDNSHAWFDDNYHDNDETVTILEEVMKYSKRMRQAYSSVFKLSTSFDWLQHTLTICSYDVC